MYSKGFMFEATYMAVHNLYAIFEFVLNLWVYLNRKIVGFYVGNPISDDYDYVRRNMQKIDKKPIHLTVLLGNEKPSSSDLANLIIWSIASGIPYISFYDHKGTLKKAEIALQEAVNKKKTDDDQIIWNDCENPYKNGITGKRKIHVRTLTIGDGRKCVTNIAKQFSGAKEETKIDHDVVDTKIKDSYVFPDPDLGFYCGKAFAVYGYPPWQIRTTEFLSIESQHGLTPYMFLENLYKYSKTEQRLGK